MATKKFSQAENKVLTDIYRRLNYLKLGNLTAKLLYLAFPSEAKILHKYRLIQVSFKPEYPRVLNWYCLTNIGQKFFSNYVTSSTLDEDTNLAIFEGRYVKSFDYSILEDINSEIPFK